MLYSLLALIATALACWTCAIIPRSAARDHAARSLALLGTGLALALSLLLEGFAEGEGGPPSGANIAGWFGIPVYGSDPLSTAMGAWVLGLALFALLRLEASPEGQGLYHLPDRLALAVGLAATLYSLAFTVDLRAFAAHLLALALLAWLSSGGDAEGRPLQQTALGVGALALLGAVLIIGRTTGGDYGLASLSLSALTLWPLLLILLFIACWLGLTPFTGWSGLGGRVLSTSLGTLLLGGPPLLLALRLQALVTEGALTGSAPTGWSSTMGVLGLLGAVTVLVGGAGALQWAGTERWSAAAGAYTCGAMAWALALDDPAGRWAALAIFAAHTLGRAAWEQAAPSGYAGPQRQGGAEWITRAAAALSLAGAPLTIGFTGLWLLSSALLDTRRPILALLLLAGALLAACGTAIHLTSGAGAVSRSPSAPRSTRLVALNNLAGWGLALLVVVGGALPGLWLPYVVQVASFAGRGPALNLPWTGISQGGAVLPLTMLGAGIALLALAARLMRAAATSGVVEAGPLLPTGLDRLGITRADVRHLDTGQSAEQPAAFRPAPPAAVWWLSLAWLERGILGLGLLVRLVAIWSGRLLARLEGRYFLPLALLLIIMALLAISR